MPLDKQIRRIFCDLSKENAIFLKYYLKLQCGNMKIF